MKKILGILIPLLVLGILLFSGEVSYSKTIKLGLNAPLTGRGAGYGLPLKRVLDMTAKKWNDEGGITVGGETYKIKIIEDDDKYKGPIARQVAEKHCFRDQVHAAFTVGSTPSAAAGSIYSKNKVLFFTAGSATKRIIGENKPYVFNMWEGRAVYNNAFWRWAKKVRGVKTVVQIFPNDDAGRAGTRINREVIYPKLGLKTLAEVPIERADVDFSAAITKAMALKPDAINFSGSPGQTALFAKQSAELGYTGDRICEVPVDATRVTEVAGKAGNGLFSTGLFETGPLMTPSLAALVNEYKAVNGQMDVMIDAYRMMIETWRAAVEKAGTLDSEKVLKTLTSMKLQHPLGEVKLIGKELWGIDRQAIYPSTISEVRDGQSYSVYIITMEEIYQDYLDRLKK
jgi:branched-chain amino acid transport system substrate-binding protein